MKKGRKKNNSLTNDGNTDIQRWKRTQQKNKDKLLIINVV